MKKILFILLIFASYNLYGQGWYHNMEKYWWYRYKLVNDFLYIDPTDSPGSSIPAQYRYKDRDWPTEYGFGTKIGDHAS